MIEIAVNNLAAATGARTVTGEADRVCRGCVIDSRQVEEGTIFVAFPGENVDGNDFASRAVQSGAGAVVMTREPEAELVSLAVTLLLFGRLYRKVIRELPDGAPVR